MLSSEVAAFVALNRIVPSVTGRGTALHAARSRRNIFRNIFTATLAAFVRNAPAVADDSIAAPPQGANVILFEIQNLEGVEGNSGQFKIQMRPDWAPRGVQRFEVSYQNALFKSLKYEEAANVIFCCANRN